MAASTPVFRFAPSPTGALHLGHARSALLGQRMAAEMGGRFLLRIEDIDATRCKPEFVDWIFEDLAWLGLTWEKPVMRQSARMDVYAVALQRLEHLGLTYPCFATRTEIVAASFPDRTDPDGAPLYPGIWRDRPASEVDAMRSAGAPFAIRLNMAKACAYAEQRLDGGALISRTFGYPTTELSEEYGHIDEFFCHPEHWGDVVIARKETPTSYHLAVVVDDAAQGVTHVTRGADLNAATDVQRLLQVVLDLPAPLYRHHPLILDVDGRKLSKSLGSTSLRDLRAAGVSADEVRTRALGSC